jgi:two-component system, OmpR family, sensor histidine kinase CpxA
VKPRWTLSRKILCLALMNVALLAAALLAFARTQFRVGPESLLLGPAHDRIRGIGDAFTTDFEAAPESGRAAVLDTYSKRYGAEFHLVAGRGEPVVGPGIVLPQELMEQMRRLLPPPGNRGQPPGLPPGRPPGRGGRRGPPPRGFRPPPPEGEDEPPPSPPQQRPRPQLPTESVFVWAAHDPAAYWAGARIHSPNLTSQPGNFAILLIRSGTLFNRQLFFDWRPWLAVALIVIAVSAACWLPFIRGLTRSIAHMDRVTQQIAEGRFDVQAAAPRSDELGHLGQQIDRMATRLQSFVGNQKRFLGDIAHELCAPIARIQFALGILEQKAEEGQRGSVAALHEEVQEMSGLVNELLSFSKAEMDSGRAPVAPVSVRGVVDRAVAREAFGGVAVETQVADDLAVMANEGLLLRAVANVLRNAIRYAGEAGPIAVSASREGEDVAIVVADSGPGLPEAELEQVFTPFYRPDTARTRETGGAGLGLAIVRTCVEACGGTVVCRNRKPAGLEVAIRLKGGLKPAAD